jgi:high affinity Mn2+ porin
MRRSYFRVLMSGIVAALFNCGGAIAADVVNPPIKAAKVSSQFNWMGFYAGGHVGYGRGRASTTLSDPASVGASNSFGTLIGGVHVGYNYLLSSRAGWDRSDLSFQHLRRRSRRSRTTATTDVAHRSITHVARPAGLRVWPAEVYGTGGFVPRARFLQTPGVADDQDKILRTLTG